MVYFELCLSLRDVVPAAGTQLHRFAKFRTSPAGSCVSASEFTRSVDIVGIQELIVYSPQEQQVALYRHLKIRRHRLSVYP